jgi:NitT/TauT family transport system substrate-binding protein
MFMRFWRGVLACLLVCGAAQAESLTVAVPQKGQWDTGFTDFGIKAGFFKEEGLDVTTVYTQGGSQTIQSVISGSVDLAVGTGTLGVLGAYAKGAPLRVLSAEMTGAPDLIWVVKADSPVKTMKDMAGKTISFSEAGSSSNLVLLGLIQQAGIKAAPVSVGGVPNSLTQVASGQIDAGWAAIPFGLQQVKDGTLRILARGNDVEAFQHQTIRVNFSTAATLAGKADAIAKYNRAYLKTLAWAYSNPASLPIFSAYSGLPETMAKQVRDEFIPAVSVQPYKIEGLDLLLKEALEFKYITKPTTPADVAPLFADVVKPAP